MNLDDDYAFRVRMLVVFGSYLDGGERLNDVDMACQLAPRWSGERQDEAEMLSRGLHAGRFRNVAEWAIWPKLEVLRFLKSGSRGLSIQELDDWIMQQAKHLIVFEERARQKGGTRE